ncbi:MAG TPA: choice-of-anchor B family protein [Chitinophagales bacterium]|nr:choice-of-anchor B family protein [Chitinophagales bacterium]
MIKQVTPLLMGMLCICGVANAQLNTELLGHLPYADQLSNLTGWSDGAGNEYAIVGTYDGTSIVDITDPTDPTEVAFVNGNNSIWREVRTWDHYAYVVTEAGGGLLCIDLSGLPASVSYNYTNCGIGLSTGHTVFCDENGFVHIFGSNIGAGGDQILDANANPMDPEFAGEVDMWYIHDGYVRGDTLWAGNIYNGWFSVWDISDKTSPVLKAQQSTPDNFTHNTWLTDDGNYLFTTDEVTNATVASYDVSDLTDIKELDQFQANPGTNSIPHNVMVLGDFLVTAYYRDGVVITDATYPDNMIKVGEYDTSPFAGDGFNGAWGSWPYLPSGNIIVSDMEEGLFIVGPTYVKACYVEGNVTDASTGAPIFGATVNFTGVVDATSDLIGDYHGGVLDAGTYDFTFNKTGYLPETVTGVVMENGIVAIVDAELTPLPSYTITGQVLDAATGAGIAGADVLFQNALYNFSGTTDASGNFSFDMYEDDYDFIAGDWGYVTNGINVTVSAGGTYTITLSKGYYDDFIFANDWTTSGTTDVGMWERGEPNGTFAGPDASNPDFDVTDDYGDQAYVTGNEPGGTVGTDDVDNGIVNLISPSMDLTGYADPVLSYDRWFFNGGGTGTPNDTLRIFVSNGIEEVLIDAINSSSTELSEWVNVEVNLSTYIDITSDMHVRFRTADQSASGHLVEAGVDLFMVYDNITSEPTTAFGSDVTTGCGPLTVVFDDMSVGATSWSWTFPGGTPATSTLQNPTVVYATPGTYDVTLVASNIVGESESTTTGYVTVNLCNAIDEVSPAGFTVSPNPFNTLFSVEIEAANATDIRIIDITGRIIRTLQTNGEQVMVIAADQLPAGIYTIELLKNNEVIGTTKAVKAE